VVLGEVVPSVNTDSVIVLDPGSVEAVVLTEEVATGAVGVGLQNPDMLEVPNGDVTGSGATEEGDEDVNPGVPVVLLKPTTLVAGVVVRMGVAVLVAELAIPIVGHSVIAPRKVPGIGPKVPRLSCTAPNGLPAVPTVGIVPGMAIGNVMVDDVVGVAGVRRVLVDPTWAAAVPQPIRTAANIMRTKRCTEPP
jgi:hypothetical protein